MINICLLGATGSIGTQTLDIIRNDKNYCLVAFSFGENIKKAEEIINEFSPKLVSCKTKELKEELELKYPNINFVYGDNGLNEVATYNIELGEYIDRLSSLPSFIGKTLTDPPV